MQNLKLHSGLRTFPSKCLNAQNTLLAALIVASALIGCNEKQEPAPTETQPKALRQSEFRIVCLSPALTDMLVDLGLEPHIVGRDAWDERLTDDIPRVGDLSNLNLERLIALDPSDLVMQAGRKGIPKSLEELATQSNWNIINVQIDNLADVRGTLQTLASELSFQRKDTLRAETGERAQSLLSQLDEALMPLNADAWSDPGSILLLYSTARPAAFGPGSYLSDMLQRLGARNALTEGGAWRELDAESLVRLDPWAIVVLNDGPVEHSGRPADVGPIANLNLRAVGNNRCLQLSHPRGLLPGTSLIEVAQEFRKVLHQLNASASAEATTDGNDKMQTEDDR